MTAIVRGTQFGKLYLPKDKVSEDPRGRKVIQRTYRTLWSSWYIQAPLKGSSHPTFPKAALKEKTAQQIDPGWLCDVELTYEEPEEDGDPPNENQQLPPDEYTESVNDVEMPIEAHPDFATFATTANGAIFDSTGKFKGWTKDSQFSGYLTYKVGSVSESVTKYYWGKPPSITTSIPHRSGNWLTISGSIARRYPYWMRTIVRIYSDKGWNSTIYP